MIGYITSADDSGDLTNPVITVILADDFYPGFENMPKVIYTYNRTSERFSKSLCSNDDFTVQLHSLLGAVELLELEEMRHRLAMKVFFKDGFSHSITHIKSEYLEGIWFPSPSLTDGCRETCVNITEFIYPKNPSILEVSFLCDVLNMICAVGEVGISSPFYCCYNSLFADSSVLKLLCDIFGEDSFFESVPPELKNELKILPSFRTKNRTDILKIRNLLESVSYDEKEYTGTRHSFAVNIKRTCLKGVLEHIKKAFSGNMTLRKLADSVYCEIDSGIKRFVALSGIFHATENLERTEDIRFLTLYELMSAYAFAEKEITLKSTVRKGREKITHINKTKIPKVIYPDGRSI
ncbi:MAG: hypothetical protein E7394_04240 [Ruminococcaceae bacterium]|nr:hypothetical protein [Oscillospiraceae bacterium]